MTKGMEAEHTVASSDQPQSEAEVHSLVSGSNGEANDGNDDNLVTSEEQV